MINRTKLKVIMKRILNASIYIVPVCLNTKAFLTKETEDNLAWIKYWLFFSLLFAFEILLNFHKSYFPCYDYFKVLVLCICIVSIEINLTSQNIDNETTNSVNNQATNERRDVQLNDKSDKAFLPESHEVETKAKNVFETINPEAKSLKNYICNENKSILRKRKSVADFTIHKILSTDDQAVYVMKFHNFKSREKGLLRRFMFTVRSFMLSRL